MKIRNKETGKTLEINVQPGQPMPTDAEIDQLFATQDRRDAIVAPALAGAMDRRKQAIDANLEQIDPRLKGANEVDMEQAVDRLPVTASLAIGPAAGVPGMIGAGARAALANPEVTGAVLGAAKPLMQGDLTGAAKGAFWGALGGKVGGEGAAKLLKFVSRLGGGAAAAEAAPAAARAAGEMTQGEMVSAVRGMSKPTAGYVENPSVEKVARMMQSATDAGAPPAVTNTLKARLLNEFAKNMAPAAKAGEKVWMEVNESGVPVRVLTPGEASAVPAAAKTWVKVMK